MDGEGDEPQLKISFSLFRGLFKSKIWWKAFHFREGRVSDLFIALSFTFEE
jgi:hypothetical protein